MSVTSAIATFGFLSADLHNGASTVVWSAVATEARKLGVNLICFPGGRLSGLPANRDLRNRVYDLAGPGCLDGVITWASSLGGAVDAVGLEEFHERLRELPLVSLSHKLNDVPVIRIDAYTGMHELINHLVEVHHHSRVAFLRGPGEHQSAQWRYQAYVDSLHAHGLEPDPMLQVGPLRWDAGAEAVRILIEDRGLIPGRDFDALASASDLLSFGAFKALRDRGYRIPQDVVLVGFNGTVESLLSQPHLTTVRLPFQEQGQAAVRFLLRRWQGQVDEDLNLPSQLVIRDSCGCPSRSSRLAAGHLATNQAVQQSLPELRKRWLDRVTQLGGFGSEAMQAWFEPLADAVVSDLASPRPHPQTLSILEKALEHAAVAERSEHTLEWSVWQDAVSLLRNEFGPGLASPSREALELLADQCRVRISAFVEQRATARSWEELQRAETLREVGRHLSAAWSVVDLSLALDQAASQLALPGAWLVLTETPRSESPVPEGQARLVWASRQGARVDLRNNGLEFAATDLIPSALRPVDSPWCLVVEPVYLQDRSIGYLVFQTGNHDGALYEELRSDVSSALKGIFLMAEADHARRSAEKSDGIKTRLLANVSHELRTPLTQILGQVSETPSGTLGSGVRDRIRASAEHQLRLINDLLDLSRAEIDELDLTRVLINPAELLRTVFEEFRPSDPSSAVEWKLVVAPRLPQLLADPVRLKQILLNLLSNAAKFTSVGTIELGARTEPPHLHFWVRDTGLGISQDLQSRLFQPFVTGDHGVTGSIGLGLSITRHLVTLHYGTLELESTSGQGTTFHIRLPLPNLEDSLVPARSDRQSVVILFSREPDLPPDLAEWVAREGLELVRWRDEVPAGTRWEDLIPRCICWDMTGALARDWGVVRQLRHHAALVQAPFLLYGAAGMTALVDKAGTSETSLRLAIEAACPSGSEKTIFIVDDELASRTWAAEVLRSALPGQPFRTFDDGPSAWAALQEEVPALVILDFSMPGWDGAEVLDRLRADPRLRLVPVLLLSHKVFTPEEIQRIERHPLVTLQSKGIWDPLETGEALQKMLTATDIAPVHTSALVKRALAYMGRHYQRALSRWQVAEAVNVSEDYLSRVFSRELGLSPWDFLNRYRIHQACLLLLGTNESIRTIAMQVGFNDQAYFSRVFRKIRSQTPQEFRHGGGATERSE